MTTPLFNKHIEDLQYILARISRYQRNNQYVYLRAFDSWLEAYNQIATILNTQGVIRVPLFRLTPIDFSKSGKSISDSCLSRFVKTINRQITRLEDKQIGLSQLADSETGKHPLRRFYLRDRAGNLCIPVADEQRVVVAIPPGAAGLERFRVAIQPSLESCGLSVFLADQNVTDDHNLGEICRQMHASRLVIIDLSVQAANVMLVLGLACGSGKPVIIVQEQGGGSLGETFKESLLRFTDNEMLRNELTARLSTSS